MRYIPIRELQELGFFQSIPKDVIQTMLNTGHLNEYQKKEVVFRAQDKTESVYILLSGQVLVYNLTKHGSRKILFLLGKGHLLNHSVLTDRYVSVYCEAACNIQVLQIPRKYFARLMEEHYPLAQAVMQEYERYIWRLSHQLKNTTGNMQTERKIAAKLWKLARDFGQTGPEGTKISLNINMSLLADLVGAPRENVSRACKRLSERGLLIYRDRHFILPDPNGLADFYKM